MGARHSRSQHRTDGRHPAIESGAAHAVLLARSDAMHQPNRASGRRNRHHQLLQHRIFRRPEAQGTMAARLSPEQRRSDRGHGPRAGKDSGRGLGLLPAHRRQHGGSGQRSEGAACHQGLRRRPARSRRQGRTRSSRSCARSRGFRTWECFRFWASPTTTSSSTARQPRAIRSTSPMFRMPSRPRREATLSRRSCRARRATTW